MANIKERISWQFSPIHQAVQTIHAAVPIDLIPNFMEKPRPENSIFTTLDAVGQTYPGLRGAIGTAIKGEAGMILQINADRFSPSAMVSRVTFHSRSGIALYSRSGNVDRRLKDYYIIVRKV